jgi:hypothetical protein
MRSLQRKFIVGLLCLEDPHTPFVAKGCGNELVWLKPIVNPIRHRRRRLVAIGPTRDLRSLIGLVVGQ